MHYNKCDYESAYEPWKAINLASLMITHYQKPGNLCWPASPMRNMNESSEIYNYQDFIMGTADVWYLPTR